MLTIQSELSNQRSRHSEEFLFFMIDEEISTL